MKDPAKEPNKVSADCMKFSHYLTMGGGPQFSMSKRMGLLQHGPGACAKDRSGISIEVLLGSVLMAFRARRKRGDGRVEDEQNNRKQKRS